MVPQVKNAGRIVVPVADLDAAIEFDTSELGVNRAADMPSGDGERWVELALPRRRRHPVDDRREPRRRRGRGVARRARRWVTSAQAAG